MPRITTYEIQQRGLYAYAVLRRGSKGGTRLINVYTTHRVAEEVLGVLLRNVTEEV